MSKPAASTRTLTPLAAALALTCALAGAATLVACEALESRASAKGANETVGVSGDLTILTYNVAGLPDLISASRPGLNSRRIGQLLNGYDLALVQEDFVHHPSLTSELELPYRSRPLLDAPTILDIGDGLSRFGNHRFERHVRQAWTVCHGTVLGASDCASQKGFSVAETVLHPDAPALVVVNLHMDAGDGDGDRMARARQVDQLLAYLGEHHHDAPMIVAGDTNLDTSHAQDAATLERLLDGAALLDTCPGQCTGPERIDRIFVRSGQGLALDAHSWRVATEFVDDEARALSDHPAVAVDILWRFPEG